jgi:hypothetical protein
MVIAIKIPFHTVRLPRRVASSLNHRPDLSACLTSSLWWENRVRSQGANIEDSTTMVTTVMVPCGGVAWEVGLAIDLIP